MKFNMSKRNKGIEILRMFLCFRIVLLHCYSSNNRFINKLRGHFFQVPCFFFMSFYFLYPTIQKRNIIKMKIRLERIFVPYIIYPIIVWISNNMMFILFKINRFNRLLTLNELKIHIIIGRGIKNISVLWFLFDLQILTILFFILTFILKDNFLWIFQIIALFCYIIQYKEIHYLFFIQYTNKIFTSIGNFVEIIPLAIAAFSLSNIEYIQKIANKKWKIIFSFTFLFYFIYEYNVITPIKGMSSPGIKPLIASFFLFSVFSFNIFEFDKLKISLFISKATLYTKGIYCQHKIVHSYINFYYGKKTTFFGCIIIYIISYFISFIGFHIFSKTKLRFLFI